MITIWGSRRLMNREGAEKWWISVIENDITHHKWALGQTSVKFFHYFRVAMEDHSVKQQTPKDKTARLIIAGHETTLSLGLRLGQIQQIKQTDWNC